MPSWTSITRQLKQKLIRDINIWIINHVHVFPISDDTDIVCHNNELAKVPLLCLHSPPTLPFDNWSVLEILTKQVKELLYNSRNKKYCDWYEIVPRLYWSRNSRTAELMSGLPRPSTLHLSSHSFSKQSSEWGPLWYGWHCSLAI